jgi:hypothetical protein
MFIFFLILSGLIFGLILISLNFSHIIEKTIVYIFLFFIDGYAKTVVIKNLAAHRIKNRRSSIMFSLGIAFIIFVYTALQVNIILLIYDNSKFL